LVGSIFGDGHLFLRWPLAIIRLFWLINAFITASSSFSAGSA